MIISLAQVKGGAGKSTIVQLLAQYLAAGNTKVAVLDLDRELTILDWFERFEERLEGIQVDRLQLINEGRGSARPESVTTAVARLQEQSEVVIVDLPGFESREMEEAIRLSDLILVPLRPNQKDYRAALKTIEMINNEEERQGTDILYQVVFTQCNHLGLSKEEERYRADFDEAGIPYLKSRIFNLSGYHRIEQTGLLNTRDHAVLSNAQGFFIEVQKLLYTQVAA